MRAPATIRLTPAAAGTPRRTPPNGSPCIAGKIGAGAGAIVGAGAEKGVAGIWSRASP